MSLKSGRDVNLVLIPLYWEIWTNFFRQIITPTHLDFICLDIIFIILIMGVFRRGSWSATAADLFGRSTFKIVSLRSWSHFLLLVILTIYLAKYFNSPPSFEFSLVQKSTMFLAGPYTEEACERALFITTLSKVLPMWWVCILNIFLWLSVHELSSCNPLALIVFAIISCCCFIRFRSIICCSILHSIWNIVVCTKF